MKFQELERVARAIADGRHGGNKARIIAAIDAALEGETGPHWRRDLTKLKTVVATGQPLFRIIAKGNGKLPFLAFSSLPGKGFCPGAGDCLTFCYSFRAWRYPAAFCRQAQNAVLMQTAGGRGRIIKALDTEARKIPGRVDFRLYVDGDFGDVSEVDFWMRAIADRPKIAAYGYSKSWNELLAYGRSNGLPCWPKNYRLNLSSGSLHGHLTEAAVAALPVTRGRFVAVPIGRKVKSSDHGQPEHNRELRAAYGKKAFTCPGRCGECTPKGHACGSERFAGIDIIIAAH